MIDIIRKSMGAARRRGPRPSGSASRVSDDALTVTLTSAAWGPLGQLHLTALVEGGRPGPHMIGEIRERGRWALFAFPVRRRRTTDEGTEVVGTVPPDILSHLAIGRHDLAVTALSGKRRHHLRLRANATADLPGAANGLEVYVTGRGNVSLRRDQKAVTTAPPQPAPAGVDARAVPRDLADLTRAVRDRLERSNAMGPCDPSYLFPAPDVVRYRDLYPGLDVSVVLRRRPDGWQVSAVGRGRVAQRFLRNVLVNHAAMVLLEGEQVHHVALLADEPRPEGTADKVIEVLVRLLDRFRLFVDAGPRPEERGLVPAQWWDVKPNFGDVLGPMLIERLTGRPAINVRSFPSEDPGLLTVGSIAGHVDRPGTRIWGSGLIGELSREKAAALASVKPRSIHAVRGAQTRRVLQDALGWEVPEVYGDPGLLLPQFYEPRPAAHMRGKVALVPHYMHRRLLPPHLPDEVVVVDVREGPEAVIDQIVASRACLSSSLHGLVVAQAWQVPWAWLRLDDARLHGDRFKFEDFYSVLDREVVSAVDLDGPTLSTHDWAASARSARVPRSAFDAGRLVSAFPAG